MSKQLFLLSDGEEVLEARMMTMDEAVKAEANRHNNDLVNAEYIWYGPFDVKNPATLRMSWANEPSIH